jgi:hypothetical protein
MITNNSAPPNVTFLCLMETSNLARKNRDAGGGFTSLSCTAAKRRHNDSDVFAKVVKPTRIL